MTGMINDDSAIQVVAIVTYLVMVTNRCFKLDSCKCITVIQICIPEYAEIFPLYHYIMFIGKE